jgi:hypothetical protein
VHLVSSSTFTQKDVLTAITPNIRLALAVKALPVPLSGVGKSSGVKPYRTAYMMFEVKLYPQFQPRSAFEFKAVVEPYRKTPVKSVANERVPFRPSHGTSTNTPPRRAPGIPMTAMTAEFLYVRYVDPSPKSAPLEACMYGKKEV